MSKIKLSTIVNPKTTTMIVVSNKTEELLLLQRFQKNTDLLWSQGEKPLGWVPSKKSLVGDFPYILQVTNNLSRWLVYGVYTAEYIMRTEPSVKETICLNRIDWKK